MPITSVTLNPFLKDLVTILETANVGVFGTTIFTGSKASLPDGIGPFLTIRESGGARSSFRTHNSPLAPDYVHPSAQIMARGEEMAATRNLAQAAYNALFPIRNQFINGTWWVAIHVTTELMDLGEDDPAHPRIAFNIDCEKRPSVSIQ